MKMAIKISSVLGLILLICASIAGVSAQERREHQPNRLQEVLGLTDAQVSAIRSEQQAAETQMHDLRVQVQGLEEQVYQAAEETGDPTTVGKLVLQKIALQKQIKGQQAALRENINSVLTPAQQDKLKQMKEADQVFRGWDAFLTGGRSERLERHPGVPRGGGGGGPRPHRERPPEK